jgi:glutamate--cysteine ligase
MAEAGRQGLRTRRLRQSDNDPRPSGGQRNVRQRDPVRRRFDKRLQALAATRDPALVQGGLRGVEKECLRVTPEGYVAQTDHPQALGSALTNRYITTDYSEALIELITPPERDSPATIRFLSDIHQFSCSAIGDELFWAFSMPCRLRTEDDIPIARYGSSNVGSMKTVYRRGLGHRYGRYMQAIAGVHFNYSVPDAFWPAYAEIERSRSGATELKSAAYLAVVRNVRRLDWLLLYLFGASPAVCKCFLPHGNAGLAELDAATYYAPHATSLRMSDIGYQNASQGRLWISANSLEEYVADLTRAIRTPHPGYEQIGVLVDGVYRQLNPHQLQIENEYYSTIRPKRSALSGERPTAALRRGGVEYVELRALDLDPFSPTGVNETELRFAEIFLLYALLLDSPPITPEERGDIDWNHGAVARRGREPGLLLRREGRQVPMQQWAGELLQAMQAVAELLDAGSGLEYGMALRTCAASLDDPGLTPAARVLREMRDAGQTLGDFGLSVSRRHRDYFLDLSPEANRHYQLLEVEAQASLDRQCWIEEHDTLSFEEYLAAYYS